MLKPGLVSISFRTLSPTQIIAACVEAQLEGIEWGGDKHVPHGDAQIAREVGQMTRDAGLQIAAYGSYYRCDNDKSVEWARVLESASALGATTIRVWAGNVDWHDSTLADFTRVIADLERISQMAHQFSIATEFHGGTLTATAKGALEIVWNLTDFGIQTLWQPLQRGPNFEAKIEENLADLAMVAPFLSNVHVYEWANDANGEKQALSLQNSTQWPRYIQKLREIGGERWLLLEYVPGDDVAVLAREAGALRGLLKV